MAGGPLGSGSAVARPRSRPYTPAVLRRTAAPILILLLSVSSAAAATEVTFQGGRTLLVDAIEYHGKQVTLTLSGGGSLTVESARIESAAERPTPPPESSAAETTLPAPPPETPAPTAAPPGGAVPPPSPVSADTRSGEAGPPDVAALIAAAARKHDVDPELLRCLIEVESGYDPRAVSSKGAQGLAQLMPATARGLNVTDPFDPAQAVDGAARLLHELLARSGGRFVPALAAYNAGSGSVARYGGVPPYHETIAYVERILTLYGRP